MKQLFLSVIVSILISSITFGQGTIRGKINDETGEPVIGATIKLKSNATVATFTDFDGNYSLKIADSNPQIIQISSIGFETIEESINPKNGEVLIKNMVLPSISQTIKEVEIVAKVARAKDYYMDNVKKQSPTTIDFISSEIMKKTGDANVTAAVSRVTGVSTNGGFITVRGIGDRYVKTTINGSRIPTLDPFTNNIKLDIFPASLVDNIVITKTASPDLPGDWAGAYLSVETKDYPDKLSVNVETTFGYNYQTTFKEYLTTEKSATDWLGYDKDYRNIDHTLQSNINTNPTPYDIMVANGLGDYYKSIGVTKNTPWVPEYTLLGLVKLDLLDPAKLDDKVAIETAKQEFITKGYYENGFNKINENAVAGNKKMPNNWTIKKAPHAPINLTQGFSIGSQFNLFGKPLGFIGGFRYSSSILNDTNSVWSRGSDKVRIDSTTELLLGEKNFKQQISTQTNAWSALCNVAYKLSVNNSISLLFMPNLIGVNRVRNDEGENAYEDGFKYLQGIDQFYEQRKQMVYQIKTEHFIPIPNIKIEFNASYTEGSSSAPDFKTLIMGKSDTAQKFYSIFPTSSNPIKRGFRYLHENVLDSRLSIEIPLIKKPGIIRKVKLGAAYQENDKKNDQYTYFWYKQGGNNGVIDSNDIDKFFDISNYNIDSSKVKQYYIENNYPTNHSFGYSKIKSAFGMIDYVIFKPLRISGGLRIEHATIYTDISKFDSLQLKVDDKRREFIPTKTSNPGSLNELSFLPSVNVVYKINKNELAPINARLNYSKTIARPSIRELAAVWVYDFELRRDVTGNPNLKMVSINNYDFRLESYFKSKDNISLSVFYKDFKNHIELIDKGEAAYYTWQNADISWVKGIELEGRKSIFKQLEFRANVTLVKSQSILYDSLLYGVDTIIHTMFGQAPYIVNSILTYNADSIGLTATISYNVQGPRLVIVSKNGAPDVFELPRHLIDFKISKTINKYFSASFTVKDILNTSIRRSYKYEEGYLDYDRYTYGTNYAISIIYKF